MLIPAWLLKSFPPQLLQIDCTEMKEELPCDSPLWIRNGTNGNNCQ